MPKQEMNYSNTIIYKIVCKDLSITDVYVGHTINFRVRKNKHKASCINETNKSHNLKLYQTIRVNGNWDNWDMIEIEKYSCNDVNEAKARERYWYEILNANLNMNYPVRTKKEYAESNKQKLNEYYKQYREENKDVIKIKQHRYREENKQYFKEKNKKYLESKKEQICDRMKQYYCCNKDSIKERNKQYRESNKKKLSSKVTCECGKVICFDSKRSHQKSKFHQDFISNKLTEDKT